MYYVFLYIATRYISSINNIIITNEINMVNIQPEWHGVRRDRDASFVNELYLRRNIRAIFGALHTLLLNN